MNLRRRGMDIDTRCVICQRFNEDGAHLFFKCKLMQKVWCLFGLNRVCEMLATKQSTRDVIEAVLAMKEDQKLKCC